MRVAIAPLLRGFQAEFDAAAKRTKAADGAFLAVYKKLVHMPGQCFALCSINCGRCQCLLTSNGENEIVFNQSVYEVVQ